MSSAAKALSLYRSLLRAHRRHLPAEMRALGDSYVQSEFRLHKTAKPEAVQQFFQAWEDYLDNILMTARARQTRSLDGSEEVQQSEPLFRFGSDLPPDVILSEEQQTQLQKLKDEATKAEQSGRDSAK